MVPPAGTLSLARRAACAIVAATCASVGLGGLASAQPASEGALPEVPLRVRIALEGCTAETAATTEMLRVVRLELGEDGVEEVTTDARADVRARITIRGYPCDAVATSSTIAIDDAITEKWVRRVIPLTDVGEAERPRTLAIATAELLRASWAELAFATDAEAPPALMRAIDRRLAPRVRDESFLALPVGGAFSLRVFPSSPVVLFGARLGFGVDLDVLHLVASASVHRGSRATDLGDIDLLVATGAIAGGFRIANSDRLLLDLDARVELGGVSATGDPRDGSVQAVDAGGALVLGALEVDLAIRVVSRLWITLGVESGLSLAGVDLRAGTASADLSGAYVTGLVGIARR